MGQEQKEKASLLSVRHLSISFTRYKGWWKQEQQQAIQDLSLEVRAGEMMAVVGSSGSGKSLLAHGIMGLLPYNASWEGDIFYKGELLTEDRLRELRGREIVLVPQGASYLNPFMTTGEQVRQGRRDLESRTQCRKSLERYGLGAETELLYPFQLSGGMARRVMIAAAVQKKPCLVIADEPTPGLHKEAAKWVLSHFREIAEDGAGVLLITHDLELAIETADRIVVFYAGTNLEEAQAGDFTQERQLRHPYTRALFHAMPGNGFQAAAGTQPYKEDFPKGCVYEPRCPWREERCKQPVSYRQLGGGWVRCWRDL